MGAAGFARGGAWSALALEDDLRDCLFLGVWNRQWGLFHAEFRGEFCSLAVECNGRTATRHADHFAIAPPYAMVPAGAQSLHGCFLGCEASRVTLHAICLGIAIAHLSRSVDALQKTLAETLDGLADAGNFCDVDACAYDHDADALGIESYSNRSPR